MASATEHQPGLWTDAPPYIGARDERRQFARWALWDLVEGLRLWKMWLRMSWNEVRRRYTRTMLGPMWVTVSLLVFATVLSAVFAGLWNQNVRDYLPFLLSGMLPWNMVAGSIGESCAVFLTGEALIKSRQFPYTSLVHVVLTRNVIIFGHNLVGFVAIALFCNISVSWATLLFIPGTILALLNIGWMCIVIAILCLRFRDFQQLVATFLQIAMFVTPIFWAADQLKGKRAIIADGNILYHMIQIVREPLLGRPAGLMSYVVCGVCAIVGWLCAYWLLARKRHRLAYWY